jgi:O-antigen/teichoic acid export membrane protein
VRSDRVGVLGTRIARNTLHAAGGRLAALLVWLLYTPYLLSSLGPERFGLWSMFFAITRTLAAIDLGLSQATLRYVADAKARSDEESGGAFATLAVLAFLALGAIWLVLALALRGSLLTWLRFPPALRPEAGFILVSGAAVFVIMGIATVAMAVAQGYGRFDLANLSMLTLTAQHAIGIPIVLSRGWGLRGLILNVGIGWLLGLIVALVAIRRAIPSFRWASPRAARGRLREAIRFGGPMQVAVASYAGHQHIDKFLLVPMVSMVAVADYELGYRVSNAALSLVQLLLLAVLPAAAELHASRDPARLQRLYRRGNRYVLAATALLFAPLAAASSRLLDVWLGPGHAQAALALRGLSLASALFVMAGMGTSVARGLGRTGLEARFAVVVLVIHVAIAVTLMPSLGLVGAMIAMVASTLAGVVFFLWRLAAALGWPRWRTLAEPHLVPLGAGAAGLLLGVLVDHAWTGGARLGLVAVGATSALAVTAATFGTGYLRWREVRALIAGRDLKA